MDELREVPAPRASSPVSVLASVYLGLAVATCLAAAWNLPLFADDGGSSDPPPVKISGVATYLDGAVVKRGSATVVGAGAAKLLIAEGKLIGTVPALGTYVVSELDLDGIACAVNELLAFEVDGQTPVKLSFRRPVTLTLAVTSADGSDVPGLWGYVVPLGGVTTPDLEFGELPGEETSEAHSRRLEPYKGGQLRVGPVYDSVQVRVGGQGHEFRRFYLTAEGDQDLPRQLRLRRGGTIACKFPLAADRRDRRVEIQLPGGRVQKYSLPESTVDLQVDGLVRGEYEIRASFRNLETKEWEFVRDRFTFDAEVDAVSVDLARGN